MNVQKSFAKNYLLDTYGLTRENVDAILLHRCFSERFGDLRYFIFQHLVSVKSEELCVKTVVRSILLKKDSTKKFVATLPKNTARRTAG